MTIQTLRPPLALVVEVLWCFAAVAVFVQWFGRSDGPGPSFVTVAVFVITPFVLSRLLQRSTLDEHELRRAGAALSVAGIVAILLLSYGRPPWDLSWIPTLASDSGDTIGPSSNVLAGVVALLPLWLRGVLRGQPSEIEFDDVLASASIGLIAVAIAAITDPVVMGGAPWGAIAVLYCVVALATLAVFRAPDADEPLSSLGAGWPAALGAAALVAVGIGFGAASIDRSAIADGSGALFSPMEPIARALLWVLGPILALILLPFQLVAMFVDWLLPNAGEQRVIEQPPTPDQPPPPDQNEQPAWFRVLLIVAGTSGVVLLAILGVGLLWLAFRRFVRREEDRREQREDLEPASSLADDLGSWLGSLGRRLRRTERSAGDVAIRRLYAEMLDSARARGLERRPGVTPLQFAPELDAHFAAELPAEITKEFVESRYGERTVGYDRVAELKAQWRALAQHR